MIWDPFGLVRNLYCDWSWICVCDCVSGRARASDCVCDCVSLCCSFFPGEEIALRLRLLKSAWDISLEQSNSSIISFLFVFSVCVWWVLSVCISRGDFLILSFLLLLPLSLSLYPSLSVSRCEWSGEIVEGEKEGVGVVLAMSIVKRSLTCLSLASFIIISDMGRVLLAVTDNWPAINVCVSGRKDK